MRCPDGSGDLYERHGNDGRELAETELSELEGSLAPRLVDLTERAEVNIGPCCGQEWPAGPRACIVVDVLNCGTGRAELFEELNLKLEENGLGNASLAAVLHVYDVPKAPRCEGSTGACEPKVHPRSKASYDPNTPRCPNKIPRDWPRVCTNDGECEIANCGGCQHWTAYAPLEPCGDQVLANEHGTPFCGCLAGRCLWFKQ